MDTEKTGAGEDLGLHAEDAENVIGGKKQKKTKAKAKTTTKKAVKTTQSTIGGFVTPRELSRDEKLAANAEAEADGMTAPYDVPDLVSAD